MIILNIFGIATFINNCFTFRLISDPLKAEGMSNAMIGGVVGGLIFLFIAVILAVMAIKFFSKRRQRERAARYGKSLILRNIKFCPVFFNFLHFYNIFKEFLFSYFFFFYNYLGQKFLIL